MALVTEKFSGVTQHLTILSAANLNAVADGSWSAQSAVYDNSVNLDRFGMAQLNITFAVAPNQGSTIDLYALPSLDGGTNYQSFNNFAPGSVYLGSFEVNNLNSAQNIVTERFELPPTKMKFVAFVNGTGQPTPATATVDLYTFNRQYQ
jgi:hypothetical protein